MPAAIDDGDDDGGAQSPDLLGFLDDFELPHATAARFACEHVRIITTSSSAIAERPCCRVG